MTSCLLVKMGILIALGIAALVASAVMANKMRRDYYEGQAQRVMEYLNRKKGDE